MTTAYNPAGNYQLKVWDVEFRPVEPAGSSF